MTERTYKKDLEVISLVSCIFNKYKCTVFAFNFARNRLMKIEYHA